MSYLLTEPEMLATAATDMESIGSTLSTAATDVAGRTTGLAPAAEDEVSAVVAQLFGAYGQEYQAVIAKAAAFHSEFTQALAAAGNAYAHAEAAATALLSNETPTSSTSLKSVTALIMGGTDNPQPDSGYMTSIVNAYINPRYPRATPQGLFTPEQFLPVTPQLGNLTFGQSVSQGVTLLNNALVGPSGILTQGKSALVFGYSQSATIATNELNALIAAGSPYRGQLSFMMIGDPNNPDGGILERFPGFYIPYLNVAFNGAVAPSSPYPTTIYTAQYDAIADFPQYPLHLLSDINAVFGYFYVHTAYPTFTAAQVANAVALPTSPGYTGSTQYYMFLTQDLPLLDPIRQIPYLGNPIADLLQPDLRVIVDLGYADYGPGLNYANISTPAGLLSVPDPFTIIHDLALGAVQGSKAALVDLGLLPQSALPTVYPYVPSIDPGLHFFLGQPNVTDLSVLSTDAGAFLDENF